MTSSIRETMRRSLVEILKPIVRLILLCGLSFKEFSEISKAVFVIVARDKYGVRGRPTNISRIAAMTGLSRKEIAKIEPDTFLSDWSPDSETTPVNRVVHYWHFDHEFSESAGRPRILPLNGDRSFSTLVHKYAGDIPVGAVLKELLRTGTVEKIDKYSLEVKKRYSYPENLNENFVNDAGFSLRNLGNTLAHNAELVQQDSVSESEHDKYGHFERAAWTTCLPATDKQAFRKWVRREAGKFIEEADFWIGEHESVHDEVGEIGKDRVTGVGIYYFEEDS